MADVAGHAPLSDPFRNGRAVALELAVLKVAHERRAVRVCERDLDIRRDATQVLRDARQRATGADGARERVQLAAQLLPELGTRALKVRLSVAHVVPLVGVEDPRAVLATRACALCHSRCDVNKVVGIAEGHRGHLDDRGTRLPEQVLLLLRLRVGKYNERIVAKRRGSQREADPGVARRAFDDEPALAAAQDPVLLGATNHPPSRSVLDRPAGSFPLTLAVDAAARSLRWAAQVNQSRSADELAEARLDSGRERAALLLQHAS
mmetsp:Transcript_63347/g.168704  ORF Transcript_63347/g.168704 Transcript_63347/m.168704 type:complete len:264 (-) Transcript_63347:325-1116(-)